MIRARSQGALLLRVAIVMPFQAPASNENGAIAPSRLPRDAHPIIGGAAKASILPANSVLRAYFNVM
jgi:hypothetical protein